MAVKWIGDVARDLGIDVLDAVEFLAGKQNYPMNGLLDEEKVQFLTRLAGANLTKTGLARWRQLATDPEEAVRERAIEVLAKRAPQASIDVFIQEIPHARPATQNTIVAALASLASSQGLAIAEKLQQQEGHWFTCPG